MIGTPSAATYLPTDERRLLPSGADADQDLFALYTQYGRYLAIASHRPARPNLRTYKGYGTRRSLRIGAGESNFPFHTAA